MEKKTITTSYTVYNSSKDLYTEDQKLLDMAYKACDTAYAPYSDFPVGAALRTEKGTIFSASNQENVSFPAGTCAERSLVNFFKSNYPLDSIESIAIVASKYQGDTALTPCGFCRQVLSEVESLQKTAIRLLILQGGNEVWVFDSLSSLLPLGFEANQLRKS